MRLTISGTVTPDCTIADTGEPAGTHSGQDYWTWEAGGQTWYLWNYVIPDERGDNWYWVISQVAPKELDGSELRWAKVVVSDETVDSIGNYPAATLTTGTVTVTEYIPDEYLVVKWTASGEFTVLKKV